MREEVEAKGHENVRARHPSTFEVTTDDYLTESGDCILGVQADHTPQEFDPGFVRTCQQSSAEITVEIIVGSEQQVVTGYGHPELSFASDRSFVCRTSSYIDDRTVLVGSDTAAVDIDRAIIRELQQGENLRVVFRVTQSTE